MALQRSYDAVYLVRKNAEAEFTEIWTDQELPAEKEDALKIVTEAVDGLSKVLKEATLAKFSHVFDIATTIHDTLEKEDEDLSEPMEEDLEATDTSDDIEDDKDDDVIVSL